MVIEYFMEWVLTAPVTKRVDAAVALARACIKKNIQPEERDEIEAALTVLIDDNAPAVRLAIAETFGAFGSAPRHLMTALASDNTEISVVVLSQSPVFHDAELVNFIQRGTDENQIAISCRPWLSPDVISAICHMGCRDAALGLLMNSAARFSRDDLHAIASNHGVSTEVRLTLLDRSDLAAETRHLLIGKLGEALGGLIARKSWLPKDRLETTIGEAFDKASIIFAANTKDEEIVSVVRNLMSQNRLTVSFLVRAICMGNISLVACALSELSGIRFKRAEAILTSNRRSAFKALYERAGLPQPAFVVFATALNTWRRLLDSGSRTNQARLPFLVTKEVLESYAGTSDGMIDDLLVLLRKLSAETARESSRAKAIEISSREKQAVAALPILDETEDNLEAGTDEKGTVVLNANNSQSKKAIDVPEIQIAADAIDPSTLIDVEPSLVSANLDNSDSFLYVPSVKAA
ncbi:MAG: DUF2336 domain-containing protein [Rhizobiaceae bacterium]